MEKLINFVKEAFFKSVKVTALLILYAIRGVFFSLITAIAIFTVILAYKYGTILIVGNTADLSVIDTYCEIGWYITIFMFFFAVCGADIAFTDGFAETLEETLYMFKRVLLFWYRKKPKN